MVGKCANPACSATFRYLHEGELFTVESKTGSLKQGPPADPEYAGSSHVRECFWLCPSCCRMMTVQSDGEGGVILMPKGKMLPVGSRIGQPSGKKGIPLARERSVS